MWADGRGAEREGERGGGGGRDTLIDKEKGTGVKGELLLGLEPAEDTLHSADTGGHGVSPQTDSIMEEFRQAYRREGGDKFV